MNTIDLTPGLIVFDLEVSHVPTVKGEPKRHITQFAALDPSREKTDRIFMAYIKLPKALRRKEEVDFAPDSKTPTRYKLKKVLPKYIEWINEKHNGKPVRFVSHNGIKHDWPIFTDACLGIQEISRFWKPFDTLWLAN